MEMALYGKEKKSNDALGYFPTIFMESWWSLGWLHMYTNSTTFISTFCMPSTVYSSMIQSVSLFSDFYILCSKRVTNQVNK